MVNAMKAAEARKLKIGDFVRASFGCYEKKCEIISIAWPKFTLRTKDYRGDEMIRVRNYRSLWSKCEPDAPKSTTWPSWLKPQWVEKYGRKFSERS